MCIGRRSCLVFSPPLCPHIESRPSHLLYHRTYSKTLHMACSVEVPYPVSDEPRSLTDDDFKFLMAYTGCYDRDVLQHRVLSVWREVKSKVGIVAPTTLICLIPVIFLVLIRGSAQLWVFKCIQELMFLHPRIEKHPRTKDVLKQYKDLELSSEATNGFLMVSVLPNAAFYQFREYECSSYCCHKSSTFGNTKHNASFIFSKNVEYVTM